MDPSVLGGYRRNTHTQGLPGYFDGRDVEVVHRPRDLAELEGRAARYGCVVVRNGGGVG